VFDPATILRHYRGQAVSEARHGDKAFSPINAWKRSTGSGGYSPQAGKGWAAIAHHAPTGWPKRTDRDGVAGSI
jgi:hypothetical protein